MPCSTCHQNHNSEAIGVADGPPGAPHWNLPPADMPMVFQGKTATQICEQMKDPKQNNGKSLAQLLEHAKSDPIVLWGWSPGGKRTVPPTSRTMRSSPRFRPGSTAAAPVLELSPFLRNERHRALGECRDRQARVDAEVRADRRTVDDVTGS